jgi:Fe2+ transport system protein B
MQPTSPTALSQVPARSRRFDLDHTIDQLVTSRRWGFPIMILLFTLVFWITIIGANYPSQTVGRVVDRHDLSLAQRGCSGHWACPGGWTDCSSTAFI